LDTSELSTAGLRPNAFRKFPEPAGLTELQD